MRKKSTRVTVEESSGNLFDSELSVILRPRVRLAWRYFLKARLP